MTPTRHRMTKYRLELHFRRAVRQLPSRELRGFRAWLRRFRRRHGRHCRHGHHAARTFHELDPVTGEWHRV
jgi:hypothetical protein